MSALPSPHSDFPAWYADVIARAELAEHSPVRGAMVIRPHGYAIWELIQRALDDRIKATGHQNMYLPLLVPMSLFARESELIEGFAPEVASSGRPAGEPLDDPLAIRPTSEAMIWHTYRRWIQSHRDLPLLLEPVGQRRALGDAATALPAHDRVPVAGGAHRPRDGGRGDRRGPHDPRPGVRGGGRAVARDARPDRTQERVGAVPGGGRDVHHGGHDGRPQGAPGRHLALPRRRLRARLRRHLHRPRRRPPPSVRDVLGRHHQAGGGADHDPRRRARPAPAARGRAPAGAGGADHRRRERGRAARRPRRWSRNCGRPACGLRWTTASTCGRAPSTPRASCAACRCGRSWAAGRSRRGR